MNVAAREKRGGTYLLTWTTYGSWVRGDERGFVGRLPEKGKVVVHNLPGEPYDGDEPELRATSAARQKGPPVRLTRDHAETCLAAFREVADKYGVAIHAAAVMTTHVHLVASSDDADGARLLNLFKGVSSRRLGQQFGTPVGGSWWTRHGSRRWLRTEESLPRAVAYIMDQPSPLVLFPHEITDPPH